MSSSQSTQFHQDLKSKMDELVGLVYLSTKEFPKDEQFGLTSQIRRSALSIILNYIEGFARMRKNVLRSFLEISYGSLKETKYLLYFANKQAYFKDENQYKKMVELSEDIGKMVWGILEKL